MHTSFPPTGCQSSREIERCAEDNGPDDTYVFFNGSCYWGADLAVGQSLIEKTFSGNYTTRLPSEEFFKLAFGVAVCNRVRVCSNYMYNLNHDGEQGFHALGGFQWKLVVVLAVAWLVVWLCLFRGVHVCVPNSASKAQASKRVARWCTSRPHSRMSCCWCWSCAV